MEKRTFVLTVECQQQNIEGMIELQNHHLAITVIKDSGKNHQWLLKLVGGLR